MIIKNLFINDLEIYLDLILQELCNNNIPFLFIKETNELHFDKYIIRFYTKDTILSFINKLEENVYTDYDKILNTNDLSLENNIKNKKQYNKFLYKSNITNPRKKLKTDNLNNKYILKKQIILNKNHRIT